VTTNLLLDLLEPPLGSFVYVAFPALCLADPAVLTHFSYLRVSPRRRLDAEELPGFHRFAACSPER
jgi:hypothetical protein